jgi:hypothetical protein
LKNEALLSMQRYVALYGFDSLYMLGRSVEGWSSDLEEQYSKQEVKDFKIQSLFYLNA